MEHEIKIFKVSLPIDLTQTSYSLTASFILNLDTRDLDISENIQTIINDRILGGIEKYYTFYRQLKSLLFMLFEMFYCERIK